MGTRLVANCHVKDPRTFQMVHLAAGEEPAPVLGRLITNPDCWEGGELPDYDAAQAEPEGKEPADTGSGDGAAAEQEPGEDAGAEENTAKEPAETAEKPARKTATRKTAGQ
ncbi:hypothetical protein [Streptomyces roseoviridis]|uniref:Uncharacterized protein n=1 Tax=Streptomyces roseoviridis TaxID=67361 RepID=A0ABV5R049_9ACTN